MLFSNEIQLESQAWCDVVFESKNKSYGAYQMRLESSRRHISALALVLAMTAAVLTVPAVIQKIRDNVIRLTGSGEGNIVIVNLPPETPKTEPEKTVAAPTEVPLPPLKKTIVFTVPDIIPTEELTGENKNWSNDKLYASDIQISVVANPDGEEFGIDKGDLERNAVIAGEEITDEIELLPATLPSYPGGTGELMRFISNNLRYPEVALINNVEGATSIRFVIDRDGNVSNVEIYKGFDRACDAEAMRVIKLIGKWVPGRNERGDAVRAYFTIPIRFRLQK